MQKLPFWIILILVCGQLQAQTTITGSLVHDGLTRTYSFYVPASYVPGEAVPMVIGLHGLGSSGSEFAQYRNFSRIADTANFIVVTPDGSTLFGVRFWNYGNILGSTVDDAGFIEALIDKISSQYSIDAQRVYCTGMSNGSFMSYLMACESDRFAAVAGVTGSMSVAMANSCNPAHPIPVMHIHGTEDSTNPYEGTSTMVGIDALVAFWVNQNHCAPIPGIVSVPNINPNDGATAQHYTYPNGVNGHRVELFKVIGGEHAWPGGPLPGSDEVTCMDFDASVEIWRFFNRYQLGTLSTGEYGVNNTLKLWPNPTPGLLYLRTNQSIDKIIVVDIYGRTVKTQAGNDLQNIDLKSLDQGVYLIQASGDGFRTAQKVMISGK